MEIDAPKSGQLMRETMRFALGALLIAGIVAVLAVPASAPRNYPQRKVVRFWHMWSGEWKEVVDGIAGEFNKSQQEYELVALSVPGSSANQKFLLAVSGGDPPDCMAQWNQVIPEWADHGVLTPLDSLMPPREWADFQATAYPVAQKIGCYKGHLYGVTTGINIWACYYNPRHLREAGLDPGRFPEALEGVWDWGEKLKRYDDAGNMTRMGFLPERVNMYAPLYGGGFWDESRQRVTIDTPENLGAMRFLADSRRQLNFDTVVRFQSSLNTGGFSTNWPFISGQFSIAVDGQWRVEQLAKFAPEMEYRTAPLPPPAGGKKFGGFSNGNFMIIPKGAKEVKGAWAFIKFWSGLEQPERAAEFYCRGGWLPLSPRIANSPRYQEYVAKYPQFKTFLDILPSENIQTAPPVPYQVLLSDLIGRMEDRALRGKVTPGECLRQMDEAVRREQEHRRKLGQ